MQERLRIDGKPALCQQHRWDCLVSTNLEDVELGRRDTTLELLGFATFDEYLESDLWDLILKKVLDEGDTCVCGRPGDEVIHLEFCVDTLEGTHRNLRENIVPLCSGCYESVAFRKSKKGKKPCGVGERRKKYYKLCDQMPFLGSQPKSFFEQ
jgi:hypothetical protein